MEGTLKRIINCLFTCQRLGTRYIDFSHISESLMFIDSQYSCGIQCENFCASGKVNIKLIKNYKVKLMKKYKVKYTNNW